MLKLPCIFVIISVISSLEAGSVIKTLPDACIDPKPGTANNCHHQTSYRYIKENNTCVPVEDKICRGRNRFTQSLECVWRCFDSSGFFEEVEKQLPEVLKEPTPDENTGKGGDTTGDKTGENGPRNDELHAACKDRRSDCFRSTDAYRFDAKTRQCVKVNDRKCRGANRFTMKEECIFVCLQNKGEVENRKWQ